MDEAGGAVGVVGEWGCDEEGLAGMGGLPDAVADPAAVFFLILMTGSFHVLNYFEMRIINYYFF